MRPVKHQGSDAFLLAALWNVPLAIDIEARASRKSSILLNVAFPKRRRYPVPLRTGVFRDIQVAVGEADGDLGRITLAVLEREPNARRRVMDTTRRCERALRVINRVV
jgi:hypothetical protein